jgi:putative flavoprotein involved in K+ transport
MNQNRFSKKVYDVMVIGGGQAGLAMGYRLKKKGLPYLILNASDEPTGSWPNYYDSLVLFSPAEYSSLPGLRFPGDPKRYPKRDEVAAYLKEYASHFTLPVINNTRITNVKQEGALFRVIDTNDESFLARTVVAATGSFGYPYIPTIKGQEKFKGKAFHAFSYKNPGPYKNQRIIVVGAANTAVQVGVELAEVADVTLAVKSRIRYVPQRFLGKDFHFWARVTGLDRVRWLKDQGTPVLDTGKYRAAIESGRPGVKKMFPQFTETGVIWSDGKTETIDTVIFATGYRLNLDYLNELGASGPMNSNGSRFGVSKRVPGLFYIGFSGQRSFSSAALRGVGPDSAYVVKRLLRHLDSL